MNVSPLRGKHIVDFLSHNYTVENHTPQCIPMLILMKNKLKIESMYSSEIIVLQPIGNISIALVSQIGYIFEY